MALWREQVHNFLTGPLQHNVFASVGGVKELWTAPVYILTVDFADALLADEDQMPPDGNPHPFPGELQPNNNIFVNPQFPEIGWDAVENLGQDHQGGQGGNHDHQVIALDLGDKQHIVQSEPRLFTLSLPYREKKCVAEEEMGQQGGQLEVLDLTMSDTAKRRKVRKLATTLVQSSERRFTRSCLKTDGYRPKPILAVQPKIKKKTRARNLLMSMEKEAQQQEQGEEQGNEEQAQVPVIPIAVMQRVGQALGIAPEKLSKEQLEAAPGDKNEKKSPDE
ncbi:hypothetical protein ACQ4PT_061057 [Festuca glaucescens]